MGHPTEDHQKRTIPNEILTQPHRLGDAARFVLDAVRQVETKLITAAQQVDDVAHVLGTRNDRDLRDPGPAHPHQWMVNHRVPANRQQVLVGDLGQGIKAASGPSGEDNSFQNWLSGYWAIGVGTRHPAHVTWHCLSSPRVLRFVIRPV